jgi:RNA polymerase sigma-70 factor (ECF subfamily)
VVLAPAGSACGRTPESRRMLKAIDELPEDGREVFDLIRSQGLTQWHGFSFSASRR